ncbi:HAD-IA family hydrolase [Candidatus Bathyarchaeota archaeon]|nr:HAD-IA family hydrolase [Candidatus Bathyarchaeota archaeon]
MIKAIAFDLIGTLVKIEDKEELALTNLYKTLRKFGFKEDFSLFKKFYDEAALKYLNFRKATEKEVHNKVWLKEALMNLGFNKAFEGGILERSIKAYFKPYVESAKIPSEVYEVLPILKKSYKIGLISNFTNPPTVYEILKRGRVLKFFDSIVISGEVGWRKPNPILFLKLAASLNLTAKEIVFVGDDPNYDVKGAKTAGMIAVLVTSGEARLNNKYYEKSGEVKADYKVKNISELMNLLKVIG